MSSFGHTDKITLAQNLNQWVTFSIFLAKSIDRRAPSLAGNWSHYNLCDIVTKATAAFDAETDPGVHSNELHKR